MFEIGDWVKRTGTKWHKVESVIDGDAVTKCGRRMDKTNKGGTLKRSNVEPLTRMIGQPQNCFWCSRPTPVFVDGLA